MAKADGSIWVEVKADYEQAQKDLEKVNKKINDIEKNIARMSQQKLPLEEQAKSLSVALDAAKAKLFEMQNASKGTFSSNELSEQKERVRLLQTEWNGIVRQVENYDSKIMAARAELDVSRTAAGELQLAMARVPSSALSMAKATERAEKSARRFSLRMKEVLRSALVFSVISRGIAAMREWLGKVIRTNSEATAAIARLKGALLTLAQPLLNVIIPAFTKFVDVVANLITNLSSLVSMFFGTTAEASAQAAEALYKETEALDETGAAAKKAGKSLASFDEINKLSSNNTSGTGKKDETTKPDFGGFGDEYKKKLNEITAYVSGALLAVGAILAFSGFNIPLGIALMGLGAAGLVSLVATNWGAIPDHIKKAVGMVMTVLGGAALGIGAVLAFSGANLPLGIGLMAFGAAALASAAALNWDAVVTAMKGPVGAIVALVSGALLALGAALTFSGANIPLGIALMAAGAIGIVSAAALNWNKIVEAIQGPLGRLLGLISGAMLVMGIILTMSGNLPLGIALIAAGTAGLVTVSALNWNAILDKLKEVWGGIKSWWQTHVSKFLTLDYWKELGSNMMDGLVEGLANIKEKISGWGEKFINGVKDFFGIHSPSTEFEEVGGYMMAGLEGGILDNSSRVVSAFALMYSAVVALSNQNAMAIKELFVAFLLYMSSEFSDEWNRMWNGFSSITERNIQRIISQINSLKFSLATIERDITITITTIRREIIESGSSGGLSSGSVVSTPSTYSVPALARGAVIPPNREFMAILGDQKSGNNIEAPESLIRRIVREESGGSGDQTVILKVGEDELGRVVYRLNKSETRRIGVSLAEVKA